MTQWLSPFSSKLTWEHKHWHKESFVLIIVMTPSLTSSVASTSTSPGPMSPPTPTSAPAVLKAAEGSSPPPIYVDIDSRPRSTKAMTTPTSALAPGVVRVLNPARPARLDITIKRLRLAYVSGRKTYAKLKFKNKESGFIQIAGSGLHPRPEQLLEPQSFVVTYHAVHFDKVKIDVFEGDLNWRRAPAKKGRGRIPLKGMDDWHYGSYDRTVELFDAASATEPVGSIELNFTFSPLRLAHEDEEEDLAAVFRREVPSDVDDEEEDDAVYEDAQEVVAEIMGEYAPMVSPTSEEGDPFSDGGEEDGASPTTPTTAGGSTITSSRKKFLRAGTIKELERAHVKTKDPRGRRRRSSLEVDHDGHVLATAASSISGSTAVAGPSSASASSVSTRARARSRGTSPGKASRSLSTKRAPTLSSRLPSASMSTIPRPKLLSENASSNVSEIRDMTLGVLKHEFNISSAALLRATQLLYRFENGLSMPRTGKIIKSLDHARLAVRFMKHSLCVYGALVLGFCNGTMTFRDNLRLKADEKTTCEYLGLELKDVLFWDHAKREISKTRYYIVHDTQLDAIVICCQGTIHLAQIVTDLNAEYFPLQDGACHRGILRAAQHIVDTHLEDLVGWARERNVSHVYCTGHSLGAGTASLLTILLNEHLGEFKEATGNAAFDIHGHCIATPAVANHALADPNIDLIDNYVLENDIVPRLSFGSLVSFKEMLLEANRLLEAKQSEDDCYAALQAKRVEILRNNKDSRGIIPGRVYHIYKTVRKVPRRHHRRLQIKASVFSVAYRTVDLPASEKPEIPHYVMELARPEFFAFIAPRRHIFNHHLPWAYSKGIWGVKEWLEDEEAGAH